MTSRFDSDSADAPQMAAADPAADVGGAETPEAGSVSPGLGPVVAQAVSGGVLPDLTLLELEELLNLDPTGGNSQGGRSLETEPLRSLLENAELPADLTSLNLAQLLELNLSGSQLPTLFEVAGLRGTVERGGGAAEMDLLDACTSG